MKRSIYLRRKKKPPYRRKFLFIFLLIIVVLITFLFAGRFLVIDEQPRHVDAILVLSGGEGRIEKAIELYESGYAETVILSNSLEGGLTYKALKAIPKESLLLEPHARSTLDSVQLTKAIMIEKQFQSALIVSSDYHMRRVKVNFQTAFKRSGLELVYVPSASPYNSKFWWRSRRDIGITLNEYIKLIGNAIGIHGEDAKRKLYDLDNFFYE